MVIGNGAGCGAIVAVIGTPSANVGAYSALNAASCACEVKG